MLSSEGDVIIQIAREIAATALVATTTVAPASPDPEPFLL